MGNSLSVFSYCFLYVQFLEEMGYLEEENFQSFLIVSHDILIPLPSQDNQQLSVFSYCFPSQDSRQSPRPIYVPFSLFLLFLVPGMAVPLTLPLVFQSFLIVSQRWRQREHQYHNRTLSVFSYCFQIIPCITFHNTTENTTFSLFLLFLVHYFPIFHSIDYNLSVFSYCFLVLWLLSVIVVMILSFSLFLLFRRPLDGRWTIPVQELSVFSYCFDGSDGNPIQYPYREYTFSLFLLFQTQNCCKGWVPSIWTFSLFLLFPLWCISLLESNGGDRLSVFSYCFLCQSLVCQ